MEYTKGEWKIRGSNGSNLVITNPMDCTTCLLPEPQFKPDCGDITWFNGRIATALANANLICAAVNACIKINPDNPMAVAESIGDMYEGLIELAKSRNVWEVVLGTKLNTMLTEALAKAEGKE